MKKAHLVPVILTAGIAAAPAVTLVNTSFQGSESPPYSDGQLAFQNGWLGQTQPLVSDAAGAGVVSASSFLRNMYGGASAHGGTAGVPVSAPWVVGDVLSFEVDYQVTLGGTGFNDNLGRIGFRPDGPNAGNGFDASPTIGIAVQYNQFSSTSGGSLKFWAVAAEEGSSNANALIIDGLDAGMDAYATSPDSISDFMRINWEATYDGGGTWTVSNLSVANTATTFSASYTGTPRTFTYTDGDAFYAQQYMRSGNGSSGAFDAVKADFLPVPEPSSILLLGLGLAGLARRRR